MKRFPISCAVVSFLAGVLLLGSCREKGPESSSETLSVEPASIEAEKDLGSYKIKVTSNAKWTVSLKDDAGQDVGWATLDRSSGNGDATVTVRMNENKFKSSRGALVQFKTAGGKTASVSLVQKGTGDSSGEGSVITLRMGSYNLRRAGLDEGDNAWDVRKDRLKQSILNCSFDVVGFQEVDVNQQQWLTSEFGPMGYSFWFFSPYSQDGTGSRAQGIGYVSGEFSLLEKHYFWACSTPDVMTTNDTGASGSFKRGGCCVLLQHKPSGKKVFFMDNHGCLNDDCNTAAAPVYVEMEKKYNKEGAASFFVGDMNAGTSTTPGSVYMIYTSHWNDPYEVLPAILRKGCVGTYNGFSYPTGKSRIDFVFYRGNNVEPKLYTCDNTLYGGKYPSDHFPVYVDYKIE